MVRISIICLTLQFLLISLPNGYSQSKQHKDKNAQLSNQLINELALEEKLLNEKRIDEFKSRFELFFIKKSFKDLYLNHRLQLLKFHYLLTTEKGNYNKLAQEILLSTIKLRKNKLISEAYQIFALGYAKKNTPDSAFKHGQLAVQFATRSSSKQTLAHSLRNQAFLYSYFGQNQSAVIKQLEFLQVSNELGNDSLKSLAYLDIGFILLELKNLESADLYFKRAKQLGENLLGKNDQIKLKFGALLCEIEKGKIKSAENSLLFINDELKRYTSNELVALFNFSKGKLNEKKEKFNEAVFLYAKSIPMFEKINNHPMLFQVFQNLAKCQLKLKNYSSAQNSVEESMKFNAKLKNHWHHENYKILSEIFEASNRIKDAFNFQKLYLEDINNSIISSDAVSINELAESNLREERERFIQIQRNSIELQRKEKEKLELQRKENLLISVIVAVALLLGIVILFSRTKQIQSQREQKEAEMAQALLRTQMNPHFVFNAMSVIQSYIFTHNPEKSSKFLVNFSKLMRLILENSPKEFIPMELEAEILEKYLNTQKLRFEDRFDFEIDFDEELLFQKTLVPPMITQPFVENAIEHGQLHTVENGKINVSARKRDDMLEIIVSDNGIGRQSSMKTKKIKTHKSMAINMTKERIEILNRKYRSNGNLSIEDLDNDLKRGTIVTILLPLKFE